MLFTTSPAPVLGISSIKVSTPKVHDQGQALRVRAETLLVNFAAAMGVDDETTKPYAYEAFGRNKFSPLHGPSG